MEDKTLEEMNPAVDESSEIESQPIPSPDTEPQSDEQPSYSDLLAQIAAQNKQLASMTEMLNQHFQVTHQPPVNEQTAAEMFVMAPDSITSRLLAENGIRRTENG